jgi:selT/selW/selH-like putative selenoprotein
VAAEIEERFDISPELIKGEKGIFDVRVDGDLVFSKRSAGRFPKPGEVPGIIAARGNSQSGA